MPLVVLQISVDGGDHIPSVTSRKSTVMDHKSNKTSSTGSSVAKMFTLLLIICLVECASGSCLSYGHSCWGAHGKRSGNPPASAPDWYLTKLLRRMTANTEMNHESQLTTKNNDINAIYQMNKPDDTPATNKLVVDNDERPIELLHSRHIDPKPMLDDDLLAKIKTWQIMRESPEEN